MPTSNPRINVTLSVSLDALVGRMATHQRVSKSQVLRELLETAEPALQRAVALMDAATTATAEVRTRLRSQMDHGQAVAEDAMAVILARLDRGADLVSQAEAVQGKRPARAERAGFGGAGPARSARGVPPERKNPPASNRGVKSPRTGENKGKRAVPRKVRRSA